MRKFQFSTLIAALLVSGSMLATVYQVGTYSELTSALSSAAASGDEIQLTANIAYPTNGSGLINITKSITLDGKGHTISGYGARGSNKTTIAINFNSYSNVSVVFKNLIINNGHSSGRPIETRGCITSFTLDSVILRPGTSQGITIGGNQSTVANVSITNSYIATGSSSGYAVISFNPYNLVTSNTTYEGYCAFYFKGIDGSAGSRGTTVNATNCEFIAPNVSTQGTNGFGVFVMEDDGINITLNDCGMNSEVLGNQGQELFVFQTYTAPDRRTQPCSLTITGNNSHLNGNILANELAYFDSYYDDEEYYYSNVHYQGLYQGFHRYTCDDQQSVSLTITGGTYSVNPSNYYDWTTLHNFVPSTHEVSTVKQKNDKGETVTLYRVHEKAKTANKLNDDVEGEGGGQNENTSFKLSASETVAAEKTYANYVEVLSGTAANPTVITIPDGKTLSVGDGGMVVQENAQVVVEPGGILTVSKGGTITANENSILIKSDLDDCGSYLLNPVVSFNQQPLAKVQIFTTAKKGKWQRFASPLVEGTYKDNVTNNASEIGVTVVGGGTFGTAINRWNYSEDKWEAINNTTNFDPFLGYALSNNSNEGGVTYTFEGNIIGNVVEDLSFATNSYNLFGNSYTAPIDIKELIATVKAEAKDVAKSIWLWSVENQGYVPENFSMIETGMSEFQEIPALQTFIMLNNGSSAAAVLDYEKTVWDPMMEKIYPSAPAPKRVAMDGNMMRLRVSSANGHADDMVLMENETFAADYEDGADADKYFNNGNVNIFTQLGDKKLSVLASDNIEGTNLSIQTVGDIDYTITFTKVVGSDYALQDNVTKTITPIYNNSTYTFTAQPNATLDGRFQIVNARTMPTDVANVAASSNAKGIYTIVGQYLGEESMWNKLPAGVYVINGQKIVK